MITRAVIAGDDSTPPRIEKSIRFACRIVIRNRRYIGLSPEIRASARRSLINGPGYPNKQVAHRRPLSHHDFSRRQTALKDELFHQPMSVPDFLSPPTLDATLFLATTIIPASAMPLDVRQILR